MLRRILPFVSPFILALVGVLLSYARAVRSVVPIQIVVPLLFAWALLAVVGLGLQRLLKDRVWVAICLDILSCTFFFQPATFGIVAVCMAAVMLSWCCFVFVLKRPRSARSLIPFLTGGSALFLLLPAYVLGSTFLQVPLSPYTVQSTSRPSVSVRAVSSKPDIYYIVLDGYARSDILSEDFSFDNSQFVDFLVSRGFVVPTKIQSNYPWTLMSVASTLNMDYVQDFAPVLSDSIYSWQLIPYLQHSWVRAELEREGYETYSVATDWDMSDNRTVDHYYSPFSLQLTEFEAMLLHTSPLSILEGPIGGVGAVRSYATHRAFIQYDFVALSEISRLRSKPKFVFVHVLAPHPPFVFDA